MLKIMALCATHKVGIVPHFTSPVATAAHMHTLMAFPGQVLMEFNLHDRKVAYAPELVDFRNGKVWPNDRPGLGVTLDERDELSRNDQAPQAQPICVTTGDHMVSRPRQGSTYRQHLRSTGNRLSTAVRTAGPHMF